MKRAKRGRVSMFPGRPAAPPIDTLGNMGIDLRVVAGGVDALCGIWENSKPFLLAPGSRADRVGQQATLRTASTGMSGRIPISSEELL